MKFLVVLVHGLHGSEHDFDMFGETLDRYKIPHVKSRVNGRLRTHDGLHVMARRLLDEVLIRLMLDCGDADAENKQSIGLSVLGHSLGGLIAWYFVRLLLLPEDDDGLSLDDELRRKKRIVMTRCQLIPCAFYTVSSPLLGSRRRTSYEGEESDRWTCLPDCVSYFFNNLVWKIIGDTGRQLFMQDQERVLLALTDPEGAYIRALSMFKWRTMMGHVQDFTVPLATAICMPHHSFRSETKGDVCFRIIYHAGFDVEHPAIHHKGMVITKHHSHAHETEFVDQTILTSDGSEEKINSEDDEAEDEIAVWKEGHLVSYNLKHYRSITHPDLEWRRVVFDFGITNPWSCMLIHGMVVGKHIPMATAQLRECCAASTSWMVTCIREDFNLFQSTAP